MPDYSPQISIRCNEDERKLFHAAAKIHGTSLQKWCMAMLTEAANEAIQWEARKNPSSESVMYETSSVQPWPVDWPVFKNGFASFDDRCDMLVGPCACGASHQPGEFELRDGMLLRYGRNIHSPDVGPPRTPGVGWLAN